MKNLLVMVALAFLLVAGCSNQYSVSGWGNEELGVRIGNIIDANNVEVGFTGIIDDEDLVSIGTYAIRYAGEIELQNPIVEGIVNGRPYFGLAIDRNIRTDETDFSTVVGVWIEEIFFTETRFGSERQTAVLGIKYGF